MLLDTSPNSSFLFLVGICTSRSPSLATCMHLEMVFSVLRISLESMIPIMIATTEAISTNITVVFLSPAASSRILASGIRAHTIISVSPTGAARSRYFLPPTVTYSDTLSFPSVGVSSSPWYSSASVTSPFWILISRPSAVTIEALLPLPKSIFPRTSATVSILISMVRNPLPVVNLFTKLNA